MSITNKQLEDYSQRFLASKENVNSMNSVVKNGIQQASVDATLERRVPFIFSDEVKGGEITAQKSSGRCWMFASLNTIRTDVIHKLNLKNFEFSEAYPFFWDKLEKSNSFLEYIIETVEEETDSRLIQHLLAGPIQDGGQWDMFKGILQKYGAVPKYAMPESYHSSNSAYMNKILTLKLRSNACLLREAYQAKKDLESLRQLKEEMVYDIYQFLCITLGVPPQSFDFEYRDKEGKFFRETNMTPVDFFNKYVGWNLEEKVSLINAPTKDKPYGRAYTVSYLSTVHEADPICYINVPSEVLKEAAIAQLKDGKPVWFGCDVGQQHDPSTGIMDIHAFALEDTLKTSFTLNKAQRLDYGESCLTHAMVFVGVNLDDDGKPTRWKVENSWGTDRGAQKGYYLMSDAWFDEYNYQIMVDRKYVPEKWLKALDQDIITLKPWDPMGALALVR